MQNLTTTFQQIFTNNSWGDDESVSGPGSTLAATQNLRASLENIFAILNVKTIVDAPCGDLNWMKNLNYEFSSYTGVDIVPEIVNQLRSKFQGRRFQVNNIVTDLLPSADVIFCRDCLVHLPITDIQSSLTNFKQAGFKYLMSTTFPKCQINKNIYAGDWRPINLQIEPFNMARPLTLISEAPNASGPYSDKSIGVWCL